MNVLDLVRADLRDFGGYGSARKTGLKGRVWLNANESPWSSPADPGQGLNRYPEPQPAALQTPQVVGQRIGEEQAIDREHAVLLRAAGPPAGELGSAAQEDGAAQLTHRPDGQQPAVAVAGHGPGLDRLDLGHQLDGIGLGRQHRQMGEAAALGTGQGQRSPETAAGGELQGVSLSSEKEQIEGHRRRWMRLTSR